MAKKIFKTSIEDNEIIKEILYKFTINDFEMLLENDLILKHRCKAENFRKTNSDKEKVRLKIVEFMKDSNKLKQKILDTFDLRSEVNEHVKEIKEKNKLSIDNILKEYKDEILEFSVFLWRCNSTQDNDLADELYSIYKIERVCELDNQKENEINRGDCMDDNKELFSMTLQDCIKKFSSIDEELKAKDNIINQQKEIIKNLEKNNSTYIKDIKKEISQLSKRIEKIDSENIKNFKETYEEFKLIKKENESLKQLIELQNKELKKINLNKVIKDINQDNVEQLKKIEKSISKVIENNIYNYEQKLLEALNRFIEENKKEIRIVDSIESETNNSQNNVDNDEEFAKALDELYLKI